MSLCLGEAFCIGKGDLELGPLRCILLQYRLMPGMDSAHLALCSATGATGILHLNSLLPPRLYFLNHSKAGNGP